MFVNILDLENEKILKFFSPVVKILQSIRDNISVILRKWEVLLRIKKVSGFPVF